MAFRLAFIRSIVLHQWWLKRYHRFPTSEPSYSLMTPFLSLDFTADKQLILSFWPIIPANEQELDGGDLFRFNWKLNIDATRGRLN